MRVNLVSSTYIYIFADSYHLITQKKTLLSLAMKQPIYTQQRMKTTIQSFLFGTLLLLFSCHQPNNDKQSIIPIHVDFTNTVDIDMAQRSDSLVILEANTESLLHSIKSIETINDKFYIFSKDKLAVFTESGKFLFNVGKKGAGVGEFSGINSVGVQADTLYLYDFSQKSVLKYSLEGGYLGIKRYESSDPALSMVYPFKESLFCGLNSYAGNDTTKKFTLLAEDLTPIRQFGNYLLNSWHYLVPFSSFNHEILYTELFNDTIYSIIGDAITPKYHIDYGPSQLLIDDYDPTKTIQYMLNTDTDPYFIQKACLTQYFQENDLYSCFAFKKEKQTHIAVTNKDQNTTTVYRLFSSEEHISPLMFVKLWGDRLLLAGVMESPTDGQDYHVLLTIHIR